MLLLDAEFIARSPVIGLKFPFSSAWKIWLAASTRRGSREARGCDAFRETGGGSAGSGISFVEVEAAAKFCLASSTTSVGAS
jgi:hypothetical protein